MFDLLPISLVHGLVDQASFALLYYKVHKLSITLPLHSKTFWYYAPSCLLSDILVIAGLQIAVSYLTHSPAGGAISEKGAKHNQDEVEALLQDVDDHISLLEYEKHDEPEPTISLPPSRYARYLRACCKVVLAAVSLLTSFVSYTSVVAYKSEHAIFTWKQAYDNLGSARVLRPIFDEFWPLFLLVAAIIVFGGLVITAIRLVGTLLFERCRPEIRLPFVSVFLVVYLLYAAIVRPPVQALQATNLLLDGFSFALSLMFGLSDHTRLHRLQNMTNPNETTIYGASNMYSPRVTPVDPIEHVFLIYLESGESLAWPFSPEFCKNRDCADISPEYNTPDHFTPFFKSLVTQDPNAVYLEDFRTNVAFTTKSHLATECGTIPEVKDGIVTEAAMKTALPCLPDLLRALDDKFKSSKFIAQDTTTDAFADAAKQTGWDQMVGRQEMESAWHEERPLTNWWGYSDEEIAPFWWNWIDSRLALKERIFMSWSGSTMHLPFNLPPFLEPTRYTSQPAVNGYLNTVRYTDKQLELFFEGLKKRDILDKSLVIIQGDHGPRIGPDGTSDVWGYFERIYKTPFLVRAPGLIASTIQQDARKPFVSIDVLPTILDALGVDPSIVSRYPGHSVLREVESDDIRDTFHVQIPGNQYPHILRYGEKHFYKARRSSDGDTCATDILLDEDEIFIYCAISGWNPVPYLDQAGAEQFGSGLDAGLWQAGSEDEAALIAFAKEAESLLNEHLDTNAAYWDPNNADKYQQSNQLFLKQLAGPAPSSLRRRKWRRWM